MYGEKGIFILTCPSAVKNMSITKLCVNFIEIKKHSQMFVDYSRNASREKKFKKKEIKETS